MRLRERSQWRGRTVHWDRLGSTGPAVVLCHGTPWSSAVWQPLAAALSADFTVYVWDMPGYGESSKDDGHRVSLDVQGELLSDLLRIWGLDRPHLVAHDYGGAVALRAHLLHSAPMASLALVDVVALAPWGTDFLHLVRQNVAVFDSLPAQIHQGVVRSYVSGASHRGLTEEETVMLVRPWLGTQGQSAFYRQIAQADQVYTDEVEPSYPSIDLPVLVVWGEQDGWIPVERAHRLAALIPGARLRTIPDAGHLVQLDAPATLAVELHRWLSEQSVPPR
ncbi:MAG: alpha/beta fold hydrolase [Nocardioidaceae bacterium]